MIHIAARDESLNGESKNILFASPSLIVAVKQLNLIEEYQLAVQPRVNLKRFKTKTFGCGAVVHYYEPANK